MEKFPEADQLIQPLDTGTGNSYLGHRGEPMTGDSHDQGTFPHTRARDDAVVGLGSLPTVIATKLSCRVVELEELADFG